MKTKSNTKALFSINENDVQKQNEAKEII